MVALEPRLDQVGDLLKLCISSHQQCKRPLATPSTPANVLVLPLLILALPHHDDLAFLRANAFDRKGGTVAQKIEDRIEDFPF
jgi:hypothetical protein